MAFDLADSGRRQGSVDTRLDPMLQIPVEGGKNECALSGLRVRTLGPVSAHSRGRECALSDAPLHRHLAKPPFSPSFLSVKIPFCIKTLPC